MATISVSLPSDGQSIDAADYNVPINTIVGEINGNLDSDNIEAGGVVPNSLVSGTGTSWAWQSWTPTLSGVTEGNGTKAASYIQIGKTVFYRLSFIFGSTSDVTTDVTFTLPVTSVAVAATGFNIIGQGELYDASGGPLMALCRVKHTSTTVGTLKSWRSDGTFLTEAAVNSTNPFDWTNGDAINLEGFYEAA